MHKILTEAEGLRDLVTREAELRSELEAVASQHRAAEAARTQVAFDGSEYSRLGDELDALQVRARKLREELTSVSDRVTSWKRQNAEAVAAKVLAREAALLEEIRRSVVPKLMAAAAELQQLGFTRNEVVRAQGIVRNVALTSLPSPEQVLGYALQGLSYCGAEEPERQAPPEVLGEDRPAIRFTISSG